MDRAGGYYEGYIYRYHETMERGDLVQTIRGEYKIDSKLEIVVNERERAFSVNGDVWKMSEYDGNTFIPSRYFRPMKQRIYCPTFKYFAK